MKKTVLLVGLVFMLFSCNSGNKESSATQSDDTSNQVNQKSNSTSFDCLKKFEDDYSALLTKEEMTSVHTIDFDNAKTNLRSGSYGEHSYVWPSDRPTFFMEISGMKMELPDQNTIGIKNLSFSSGKLDMASAIETFDMGYKQLSDKELEQIHKNIEKQQDGEIKSTAEDLMKHRVKSSWEAVKGLGSSAWYKWNENYGGELVVLAGSAQFTIITKISSDPDENRKLAKQLAEKVLAKCN